MRKITLSMAALSLLFVLQPAPALSGELEACTVYVLTGLFRKEPKFGADDRTVEIWDEEYWLLRPPGATPKPDVLTCRLHLDCTIETYWEKFSVFVIGQEDKNVHVVKLGDKIQLAEVLGDGKQICKIEKITD